MIVYKLFQGFRPINRVYFNDKIVWKPPTFLHPHIAYLDINGQINVLNGATIAKAFLVNRVFTEYCQVRSFPSVCNVLPLYQIHHDVIDNTIVYTDNKLLSLDTMMVSIDDTENVYITDDQHAISAHSKLYDHSLEHEVTVKTIQYAISTDSRLMQHFLEQDVNSGSILHAISAAGEPWDHISEHSVNINWFNDAISAESESGRHTLHNIVDSRRTSYAISAESELGRHSSDHTVEVEHDRMATYANGISCDHGNELEVEVDHYRDALSSDAKHGSLDKNEGVSYEQYTLTTDVLKLEHLNNELDVQIDYSDDSYLNPSFLNGITYTDNGVEYTEDLHPNDGSATLLNKDVLTGISVENITSSCTMTWIFPEKTSSDLYIAQMYDDGLFASATKNGTELML